MKNRTKLLALLFGLAIFVFNGCNPEDFLTIKGKVVDSDGNPVTKGKVYVLKIDNVTSISDIDTLDVLELDSSGAFSYKPENLTTPFIFYAVPDDMNLLPGFPGSSLLWEDAQSIDPSSVNLDDLFTIVCQKISNNLNGNITLEGTLGYDASGKPTDPVKRTGVYFKVPSKGGLDDYYAVVVTDDNGHFSIKGFEPGSYEVVLNVPGITSNMLSGSNVITLSDGVSQVAVSITIFKDKVTFDLDGLDLE